MNLDLETIRSLVIEERVAFKKHTLLRMNERRISADEVKTALLQCEVVEAYPEDRPLPSGLFLGFTETGRPIHAVAAVDLDDKMLWLITVYEPTSAAWFEGYRKRKADNEVSSM